MLFHYCSCEHNDCGYSVFLLATTTELKRLNNYTAYVYLMCAVMKKRVMVVNTNISAILSSAS